MHKSNLNKVGQDNVNWLASAFIKPPPAWLESRAGIEEINAAWGAS